MKGPHSIAASCALQGRLLPSGEYEVAYIVFVEEPRSRMGVPGFRTAPPTVARSRSHEHSLFLLRSQLLRTIPTFASMLR